MVFTESVIDMFHIIIRLYLAGGIDVENRFWTKIKWDGATSETNEKDSRTDGEKKGRIESTEGNNGQFETFVWLMKLLWE